MPTESARSAIRAERLAERVALKVAIPRKSVPAAVPRSAIVPMSTRRDYGPGKSLAEPSAFRPARIRLSEDRTNPLSRRREFDDLFVHRELVATDAVPRWVD